MGFGHKQATRFFWRVRVGIWGLENEVPYAKICD